MIIGADPRIKPYVEQPADGSVICGGDIDTCYSSDNTSSYLARCTGKAIRKVFNHHGLAVELVDGRSWSHGEMRPGPTPRRLYRGKLPVPRRVCRLLPGLLTLPHGTAGDQ